MASKIDLISNALILIGDTPINSLTGGTRAQQVSSNLYDNIVQNELSKHRWGFAKKKAQLSLTTDTPVDNEWSSIYQLPSDMLFLIKMYPNVRYQLYGDKVYTDVSSAIYADYIHNVSENNWPVYFAKMIEYALALDFSTSIRDSASSRDQMAAAYVNCARMARYTDSQQYPQVPIRSNPFTDVRF